MCRKKSSKKELKELLWCGRLSSYKVESTYSRRCQTMHNLTDTSLVRAWARTTALQRIGINLYRYVTQASADSDNSILFEFLDYEKRRARKKLSRDIITPTALNRCALDCAPLDIPLSQRLVTMYNPNRQFLQQNRSADLAHIRAGSRIPVNLRCKSMFERC